MYRYRYWFSNMSSSSILVRSPGKNSASVNDGNNPFATNLSVPFVLCALLAVSATALTVGRLSGELLLIMFHGASGVTLADAQVLPQPLYSELKQIPRSVYTSKHYDTAAIATSETLLARRAHFGGGFETKETNLSRWKDEDVDLKEKHGPSGQQLLVDIKFVDAGFLASEERLATYMIKLVELSGLTMLSYHCHRYLETGGISCVGVLLESHVAVHTWPHHGIMSLDLFSCGPNSLLSLVPEIEQLFGVARRPPNRRDVVEKPFMQWSIRMRGFLPEALGDLSQRQLLGRTEFDAHTVPQNFWVR